MLAVQLDYERSSRADGNYEEIFEVTGCHSLVLRVRTVGEQAASAPGRPKEGSVSCFIPG